MGDLGIKQNLDIHLQHGHAHLTSTPNANPEIDRFLSVAFVGVRGTLGKPTKQSLLLLSQCYNSIFKRCCLLAAMFNVNDEAYRTLSFVWFDFVFLTPERMSVHTVSTPVTVISPLNAAACWLL